MAERDTTSGLLPRVVRAAWGWRLEVAIGLGVGVLLRVGGLVGPGGVVIVLGLVAIVWWRVPGLRSRLADRLRSSSERRWVDRAIRACALMSPFGAQPRIASIDHVPAGLRVRV